MKFLFLLRMQKIRSYLIVFFPIILPVISFAQRDSISYAKNSFFIGPTENIGSIVKNYPSFPKLSTAFINEINLGWQTNGNREWHHLYNFPQYGVSVIYGILGNDSVIGNDYAVMALYYFRINDYDKAIEYNFKATELGKKYHQFSVLMDASRQLHHVYLARKDYQKALAREFEQRQIKFRREVYIPLKYKGISLSKYFADFLIEDKIILELKIISKLGYVQAKQLLTYMRAASIRLGILIYFTEEGVTYRRIINSQK